MIYEIRTYQIAPGSRAEVEKRFGDAYQYRKKYSELTAFLHTEVDPNVQRRGLGTALVVGALDDARDRGKRVVPICPFVDAYIRRHPDYADLAVADPARRP